jgi:DMSO/TMAO reductase YedYZ heme-binding membrane subunit
MTFKKMFRIGYLLFVFALVLVHFFIPTENVITAIIVLSIIFGIYQFVISIKLSKIENKNKQT